jgi:hypothetical protein
MQVLIKSILQMKRFAEQDEFYIMTHELKALSAMIATVLIFP